MHIVFWVKYSLLKFSSSIFVMNLANCLGIGWFTLKSNAVFWIYKVWRSKWYGVHLRVCTIVACSYTDPKHFGNTNVKVLTRQEISQKYGNFTPNEVRKADEQYRVESCARGFLDNFSKCPATNVVVENPWVLVLRTGSPPAENGTAKVPAVFTAPKYSTGFFPLWKSESFVFGRVIARLFFDFSRFFAAVGRVKSILSIVRRTANFATTELRLVVQQTNWEKKQCFFQEILRTG